MAGNKAAPGGKLLGLDDLGAVLNELFSCRDKWYNLGLQLLVSVSDLQKIESEYKNDHGTCLRQMLTKWLESGRGNWETLCQAIDSPIVRGDDNSLVAKLRGKFCQGEEKKTKKRKASETLATPGIPTKKPKDSMIPERLDPLDFKKQPTDDRHCIKCCTVPHNPQRSGCCNTLYCLPCSEENIICPVHKMRQSFTVDKSIKKSLMRATMKCPNWRTGCGFEDSVSKVYKQHLPECGRSCQIGAAGAKEEIITGAASGHPSPAKTPAAKLQPTPTQDPICCIYAKQGCPWRGHLGSLAEHIQECKKSSIGGGSEVKSQKPVEKPTPKPPVIKQKLSQARLPSSQPAVTKHPPTSINQLLSQSSPVKQPPSQKLGARPSLKPSAKPAVSNPPAPPYSQGTASSQPPSSQQPKLMVQCVYANKGCQWTGELKLLPHHAEGCDKGKTGVSSAPAPQASSSFTASRQKSAESAPIKQASNPGTYSSFTNIKVERNPPKPQTFGDLARSQLRPQEVKPCPCKYHAAIGCPHAVPPDQMYQHLRDNMQTHLDLAITKIAELQRKVEK